MSDKTNTILTVVIMLVMVVLYTIFKAIPEYKNNIGSSQHIFFPSKYKNIIEIKINDKTDFSILLDDKKNVYHLFFFDNTSLCLYNVNIENKNLKSAISIIIPKLIENDLLKNTSIVTINYCEDYMIDSFQNIFKSELEKYKLELLFDLKKITIEELASIKNVDGEGLNEILYNLEFISDDIISNMDYSSSDNNELNKENAKVLSDNIYKRIETFLFKKQLDNVDMNNSLLDITLIPADNDSKIFATSNSWFYKKEGKVYAYIEFSEDNKIYSFCYLGSIDSYKEGMC